MPDGSALERLIRDNQDSGLLRADEASDRLGLPLWLRVYWRKQHPELEYRAGDPTGGYPRALRNLYTWMVANPDLQGGPAPPGPPYPRLAVADVGPNRRVSGTQTSPRSESDIRIHPVQLDKVIAASNTIDTTAAQSQFFSSNGGTSWGQTTLPLVPRGQRALRPRGRLDHRRDLNRSNTRSRC